MYQILFFVWQQLKRIFMHAQTWCDHEVLHVWSRSNGR